VSAEFGESLRTRALCFCAAFSLVFNAVAMKPIDEFEYDQEVRFL